MSEQAIEKERRGAEKFWTVFAIVAVVGACFAVQQPVVQDIWKGWGYEPSAEMAAIQESLILTGTGERIFKATQPALEDKTAFNEHCETRDDDISLLGCYTNGRIYVYGIQNEELKLANNVTTAHELLHAAWERMGERERAEVSDLLRQVQAENAEWFREELEAYEDTEKLEEVYTRAATKLRNLPEKLEEHYRKYFAERQKIVEYHEKYQEPFNKLQKELQELETKIMTESEAIKARRTEYDAKLAALDGQIDEFNRCANAAGCFTSEAEFNRRRGNLLAEQSEVEEMRSSINQQIDDNNARIEQYNTLQGEMGELNDAMNSHTEKL